MLRNVNNNIQFNILDLFSKFQAIFKKSKIQDGRFDLIFNHEIDERILPVTKMIKNKGHIWPLHVNAFYYTVI